MRKLFFLTLTVLSFSILHAQVVYDYLKAADDYYNKGNFVSAAEYYEKYLGNNKKIKGEEYDPYTVSSLSKQQKAAVSSKQQAIYKLAECYRNLNWHVKAEPFYAKAASFDKAQFPLANYWYGKTLRALEKFDAADSVLTAFSNSYTEKNDYSEDATREINNLKFIKQQLKKTDSKLYTVTKSSSAVNAEGTNYAPVRVNNTVYFTSSRADNSAPKNNTHNNRIYEAVYTDGVVATVTKTSIAQPATEHQGIISLTPDGKTMFLTRWTVNGKEKKTSIFSSKNVNGSWVEPVALDATINAPESNTQEPFVMPDGKHLLFASNRANGIGGLDLWSADLDASGNVVAGTAKNLGGVINTKYDERTPFYHNASKTLVFSSNGNVGMGGFDFFASKGNLEAWSNPVNMGAPLNSVKDDMYFTSNGKANNILGDVIFSSDRGNECCLELYTLSKFRPLKQLNGIVVDCETKQPILGARVEVTNTSNKVLASKTTGVDGKYSFTLEDFEAVKSYAVAEGFHPNTVETSAITDDNIEYQTLNVLCLNKIPVDTPKVQVLGEDTVVVMNNILFEFNKADVLPESFAAIDKQILEPLQKYTTMAVEISGHTDGKGDDKLNQKLSEARANAVKAYLVSKGIAADRITTVGYGKTKPIAPNEIDGKDNPEGRKLNRRTEFRVLHF